MSSALYSSAHAGAAAAPRPALPPLAIRPSWTARKQCAGWGAAGCGARRCKTLAAASSLDGAFPGGQAGAAAAAAAPTAEVEQPPAPSTTGRRIVFAADGTTSAEEGMRYLASHAARKDDIVYLAHVICDPRTPATAVGSSSAATQWTPVRDEQRFAREYFRRLEDEAEAMLRQRFCPPLQQAGVEHEILLLRLKVHKSAAAIGEAVCGKAVDLGADMVVIVSHGAGMLADFGSVARWCCDHSPVPVLIVPPTILTAREGSPVLTPANSVVVAGAGNMTGLKAAFDYVLEKLSRPGDAIYLIHAEQFSDNAEGDQAVKARKQLVALAAQWQQQSRAPNAQLVNVAVDVVAHASSPEEGIEGNAGGQILQYAEDFDARALVLMHHGRHSMMRELQYGAITTHCAKFSTRPLVMLEEQYVKPKTASS